MSVRSLAEAIILQSIEDLWNTESINDSIDFFKGGEFRSCAEIAGMSMLEQVTLLKMVKEVIDYRRGGSQSPAYAALGEMKTGRAFRREASCIAR